MKRQTTNRHYRKTVSGRKRLMRLYADSGGYPRPAGWSGYTRDGHGNITGPAPGAYLKRYWRGQRSRAIKKRCARQLRRRLRNPGYACGNGCAYRRHTEFWWEYD